MTTRREELLEILQMLLDEEVTWFELRTPTAYIRLGAVPDELRSAPVPSADGPSPAPADPPTRPVGLPAERSRIAIASAPAAAAPAPQPPALATAAEHVVSAPFVGVFYRRPSPDQPPFVEVGDRVKADDTVCLIEVMKLFNSIRAGVDGVVTAIEVEDATLVEYGQVLMRIAPDR